MRKITTIFGVMIISAALILSGCANPIVSETGLAVEGEDALAPPPLPETGPDGETLVYSDTANSRSLAITNVFVSDGIHGENGEVDCWDTNLYHHIDSEFSWGTALYCHYFNVNETGWIMDFHYRTPAGSSFHKWDVSFNEGDVIETYAWVHDYEDRTWRGSWGPTITVDTPDDDSEWEVWILGQILDGVVGAIYKAICAPAATLLSMDFLFQQPPADDAVSVTVVDQDGNPLHAVVGNFPYDTKNNFMGSVEFNDQASTLDGFITVHCIEPDGPGSYDDNLYGREVNVVTTPYSNEDYWGYDTERIPCITVTFNTNGTTTVDYPEEE